MQVRGEFLKFRFVNKNKAAMRLQLVVNQSGSEKRASLSIIPKPKFFLPRSENFFPCFVLGQQDFFYFTGQWGIHQIKTTSCRLCSSSKERTHREVC